MSSVVKSDNKLLMFMVDNISEYPNASHLPIIQLIAMCAELSRLTINGPDKLRDLADAIESMSTVFLAKVA